MKLPNAERAFVDLAKLRDYSLSAEHKEGKRKARVFAAAWDLGSDDAEWLREELLAEMKKTRQKIPGLVRLIAIVQQPAAQLRQGKICGQS